MHATTSGLGESEVTLRARAVFETPLPGRAHHSGRPFRMLSSPRRSVQVAIEFIDGGERFGAYPEEIVAPPRGYPDGAHQLTVHMATSALHDGHRIFVLELTREWVAEQSLGSTDKVEWPFSIHLSARTVRADTGDLMELPTDSTGQAWDAGMIRKAARDFIDIL
jgi:hypothetical protein